MLRERIVPVATAAFDGTTADFWAQHWSDEQLDRLDVLHVAVDETGTPVGWVSGRRADWGGRRVLYAASAGVAPDIQGGGVSAALWRRVVERELRRAPLRPLFVVLRTGNPLVYDAWVAAAGDPRAVHPRPDTAVPAHMQAIAGCGHLPRPGRRAGSAAPAHHGRLPQHPRRTVASPPPLP
jgi:GNAT superfamily N-acetyltransferase